MNSNGNGKWRVWLAGVAFAIVMGVCGVVWAQATENRCQVGDLRERIARLETQYETIKAQLDRIESKIDRQQRP